MKIKLTRISPMLVPLVAVSMMVACHPDPKPAETKTVKTEEPPTEVVGVVKGKLSSSVKIPGELTAYHEVDIYAKENSFVKKVYVDVGSEVKEGQLLASLDAPEITSRLLEAQSRLKGQEAIYTAAKASYDRLYETSKTPGTISPNDLDQAVARKNAELAQLEALRSAYNVIAQTRAYLDIRAPFSGVISNRNIAAGAYVGPSGKGSDLPLFVLQQQSKLRLVVSVPEAFTGLLKAQNEVAFTVKSLPNQTFKAKITRLAGSLDARLRSERIEMDVTNPGKQLLPGAYAEVNLPLPSNDSSFIVPRTAVVTSTEKVFVIRITDNKAEWVDVKKGREAEGKTEVYSDDLHPGDQLVKVGTDEIRNGSAIKRLKVSEPAQEASSKTL
ncbi:MAG: efflux RND transporter periplasmic adaptor subunit [Williamsia sp.]|nr:efflux RND transporter periplasmic adaptor subunit [Williamsia sp.]